MNDPDDRRQPVTTLADVRAAHNVVAAYPGIDEARAAIIHLESAGVPPRSIALLGAYPAESARRGEEVVAEGAVGEFGRGAGEGAVGALTSLLLPGVGPVVAAGLWAVAGAAAGGVVGGTAQTGGSPAWRATFDVVRGGNFAVGVHHDDPDVVERAEQVLATRRPLAINRFPAR